MNAGDQVRCIHEIFASQAARTPEAVAVVCEGERLSYAELDRRANGLAHVLVDRGARPETIVGLCAERSVEMIVGILGILKAGAAYLPLEPTYPAERLRLMLEDAHVELLVSHRRALHRLPRPHVTPPVLLDSDAKLEGAPSTAPATSVSPANLAYVIYTSGSTGRPKGVMTRHASVVRLLEAGRALMGFGTNDVWSLFHSSAFDFSVWEMWGALFHGGRTVIVPHWITRTPALFHDLLSDEQVTILSQTPTAFGELLRVAERTNGLPALRLVIFGGEALPFSSLEPWFTRFGEDKPQLINMYGITEATVHVTERVIRHRDLEDYDSAIGKPLAHLRCYVLDEDLEPVQAGTVGELYVAGEGLARGYFGRPGLTAQRFVADPFGEGTRFYHTGDLVRAVTDVDCEFIGRADQQVKFRGHRVELGEVRTVLLDHEAVRDAVCVAHSRDGVVNELMAYIVFQAESAQNAFEYPGVVRQRLQHWKQLYDDVYAAARFGAGPRFAGRNSSYTGTALPDTDMQAWLDATLHRLRELEPCHIVELGCGVGLLVQRLAPQCSSYAAIDLSASAISDLRQWLCGQEWGSRVEVLQRDAADLDGIDFDHVDTVVLNSVVQCFPDAEYLLVVLKTLASRLRPGAAVFVGDVRHMGLLRAFHCSVQRSVQAASFTIGHLRSSTERAVSQEKDLVLEPRFFVDLPQALPEYGDVDIQLKLSGADNELTRFRYDVVLHVGQARVPLSAESIQWQSQRDSLDVLEADLLARPRNLRVSGIPNRRIVRDMHAVRVMDMGDPDAPWSETSDGDADVGEEPAEFVELATKCGLHIRVAWNRDSCGCFDVEFAVPSSVAWVKLDSANSRAATSLKAYANAPLAPALGEALVPQLREYLKSKLPEHMVPTHIMPLSRLPLTPQGKVDRQALPKPSDASNGAPFAFNRPNLQGTYSAPRSPVECTLADIWQQVLTIGPIGVQDHFLDLGGHSLSALRILSCIRDRLHVELTPREFFGASCIAGVARLIERQQFVDIV